MTEDWPLGDQLRALGSWKWGGDADWAPGQHQSPEPRAQEHWVSSFGAQSEPLRAFKGQGPHDVHFGSATSSELLTLVERGLHHGDRGGDAISRGD